MLFDGALYQTIRSTWRKIKKNESKYDLLKKRAKLGDKLGRMKTAVNGQRFNHSFVSYCTSDAFDIAYKKWTKNGWHSKAFSNALSLPELHNLIRDFATFSTYNLRSTDGHDILPRYSIRKDWSYCTTRYCIVESPGYIHHHGCMLCSDRVARWFALFRGTATQTSTDNETSFFDGCFPRFDLYTSSSLLLTMRLLCPCASQKNLNQHSGILTKW
jgi:hypothetical protein